MFDMIENDNDVESAFLYQFIDAAKKDDNPTRLSKFINPSSLKCMRQACFKGLGYTPDKQERSLNSIGITSVGSYLHEFTQGILVKMKDWEYIDVAEFVKDNEDLVVLGKSGFETKLESKKYHIHFLVDGIMKHKKENYLIEIKSMTSQKYYALKDIEEYKVQIISYATLLGLDKGILIAIDRDLLNYKVHYFNITRGQKIEWKNMMFNLLDSIKNEKVPPIPQDVERRTCSYCPYREVCSTVE